jgi:hypothetical protein
MPETYTSRPMWLSKETSYEIAHDGLHVRDSGVGSRTIPWTQIDTVRLHWTQQKNIGRFYHCQIALKGHRLATVHLSNVKFDGPLSYESQDRAYNAFVKALAARIATEAPSAKFVTGSDEMERMFLAGLVFAVAAGCLAFAVMMLSGFFGGEPKYYFVLFFGAVSVGFMWLGRRVYQWNGPKLIDPRALPSGLLAPE